MRPEFPAPVNPPARVPWLELIALFISSRVLIVIIAWFSLMIIKPGDDFGNHSRLLDTFLRWDTQWFQAIANQGYSYNPEQQSSVAFFPIYPLAIKLLTPLFGSSAWAGIFISNLALFGAIVLLWKLAEDVAAAPHGGLAPGDGIKTTRLLLFGPVTFFHSIVYSEATFLFLSVACVYAARRRVWWAAGLAGYAAALTRNAGVLLIIPMLVEFFDLRLRAPFFMRDVPWLKVIFCLLPIAGFITWATYLAWKFGDPMVVLKAQSSWDRKLTWPWETILASGEGFYHHWFKAHALTALLLLVVCLLGRLRLSLLLLGTAALLLNISARHLEAIPRLTSVIFPLYFGWVILMRRWPALESIFLAASAILLAFSTILFVNGYWFT